MDANERRARATQEAAQWWNRLCVERPTEVSKADRELFTQWLRESPLHVAELLRIAQVHDSLERFKLWGEIEGGQAGEARNVIHLREDMDESGQPRASEGSAERGRETVQPSRAGKWAIAAGICLVAILGGWIALGTRGELIETKLAERRQLMLDDGTIVQLEPETALRVRFEDRRRDVALEHGRALFRVAKDPQRPFRVSTDHTSVRAVGTAFGVESGDRGVVVTVAEGTVAVGRSAVLVAAGQQITVQRSGATEPVRTVDTARALAWAQGQLIFENERLADVVAEFNRYNRTQMRIEDRQLATRRVSGVFEATDVETLLAFIRQGSHDIRITQTDRGVVIGTSSPGAPHGDSTVQ
jgi:transmembrane sensor